MSLHVEVEPVRKEGNPFADDMYAIGDGDERDEGVSHVLRGSKGTVPTPTPRRAHFYSEDGEI